jgi:DNA polymerase I
MDLIIDGNNLAFRIFAKYPPLTTKAGESVSLIYGFMKSLKFLMSKFSPERVSIAYDGKSDYRTSIYPEYKKNRKQRTDEDEEFYADYVKQLSKLTSVVSKLGIYQYRCPTMEADDIISLITHLGYEVIIVTEDRDLTQLLRNGCAVYMPMKDKMYTEESFTNEMTVTPEQYVLVKALMGDSSDNISGIYGIGEKIATSLVRTFKTWKVLKAAARMSSGDKLLGKVLDNVDVVERNLRLVNLRSLEACTSKTFGDWLTDNPKFDSKAVSAEFVRMEFVSLLTNWNNFILPFSMAAVGHKKTIVDNTAKKPVRKATVVGEVQGIVVCSMAGVHPCKANDPDDNWLIGHVHCDHAVPHDKVDECDIVCRMNPKNKCVEVK